MKSNDTIHIFFLILVISGLSCFSKVQTQAVVNEEVFNRIFPDKNEVIILPCTRCGCFITEINKRKNSKDIDEKYFFVTDTLCNKIRAAFVHHLSNKQIDSISEDIYNITLFKRQESLIKYRIIETKESEKMWEIISAFFK